MECRSKRLRAAMRGPALAILSACGQGGRQLAGNVAGRVVTATNAGTGLAGSELVNGNSPTKHMDDLKKTVDELDTPPTAPPPKRYASASGGSSDGGFKPWMCKQGGGGFVGFWSGVATGRAGKLMDYCRRIEGGGQSTAQSSDSDSDSGGCVWKGRSYGPGESIYHTDGEIRSSDLTIHGDSFETLSGRSGPWQQCQCSSSSGTWGCV
jgi:hypothetical protein